MTLKKQACITSIRGGVRLRTGGRQWNFRRMAQAIASIPDCPVHQRTGVDADVPPGRRCADRRDAFPRPKLEGEKPAIRNAPATPKNSTC